MALHVFTEWGRKQSVVANVAGNRFRLRLNQLKPRPLLGGRHVFSNSWSPFLYGDVKDTGHGSFVRAHFDIHPFVRGGIKLMLIAMALFSVFLVPYGIVQVALGDPSAVLAVIVPVFILAFLVFLPRIGKKVGEGEKPDVVAFMNGATGSVPES